MTPTTPGDILRTLATDDDVNVRWRVGGNPSTPVDVLRALATDADEDVRGRVGGNPSTPVAVLRVLATDANRHVRWCVAGNAAAGTVATESVGGTDLHLKDPPDPLLVPARRFRAPALELPDT